MKLEKTNGRNSKSLPNVKQTINVQVLKKYKWIKEEKPDQPVEVQPNEDGSVDINFDPKVGSLPQTDEHFANLAELLPEEVLGPIGHELHTHYTDRYYVERLNMLTQMV